MSLKLNQIFKVSNQTFNFMLLSAISMNKSDSFLALNRLLQFIKFKIAKDYVVVK